MNAIPLADCQQMVGAIIENYGKSQAGKGAARLYLSIAEHLKDAARWRWVMENECPAGLSPDDWREYVDRQMRGGR